MEEIKHAYDLRVGHDLMIGDYPCKIAQMTCGGMGQKRKFHIIGVDIVTGQKHEMLLRSNTKITVVDVENYQLYTPIPLFL